MRGIDRALPDGGGSTSLRGGGGGGGNGDGIDGWNEKAYFWQISPLFVLHMFKGAEGGPKAFGSVAEVAKMSPLGIGCRSKNPLIGKNS